MMFTSDVALSYFHNPGNEPLHYLTIGQLASTAATRWPDNVAFISVLDEARFTFSDIDEQALKLAAGLLDLGLMPGDRVGLCSPNCYEWLVTLVATAKAGLIMVSMNPSYMAHEIEHCLHKVGLKAIIVDESYKTQLYYKMLCDIVPGLSSLPENYTISCNKLPELSHVIVLSEKHLPGSYRFCDILERTTNYHRVLQLQAKLRPEDIVVIQFTSGTTASPKAVPLSHFSLTNNSYFYGKRLGFDKKHFKILAQSPFFHVLGFVGAMLPSLIFGVTLVLPSRTFSVANSAETIKKEKCTMLIGTPTMFLDLCGYVERIPVEERRQYISPELVLCGGAICSSELVRKIKSIFNAKVQSAYGLTEATGAVAQSTLEDNEDQITKTVGKVSDHMEVKVVDADGFTVPLGMAGELWIRSYSNMTGYWEDKENTDEILNQDGWLKSGDQFIMWEIGYGQVVGRIKEMIIRGGENISPKEVEEYLVSHPDIIDAQVYGVSNERLGEEVGCSLRLTPGAKLTEQEVKDFCKDKIAYFKIPKYFEFLEEFPKTGSGKVQKFKLREEMEKKLGLRK
ncbi:medium-chain acyl-CoA ligase ACSF2, mitochondrial-like [Macrosteles quadrilineatus]|uniref:medium-chain acyl-CoA ligase ACSF2, mitochondrial-like n=1 Tax=Macrosteles quadrilineatus TaxID=74068 RepID=UPI0023E1B815|nr:medium-chain acyl-CoA ligase ACSF2, mitochondrial-like [Macrosteles quadrilineatus]